LVGHLGLVRYLRTGQIAELMFPGRAQSVVSERLGELARNHGSSKALLKRFWYVNREGRRVQVWALTGTGYAFAEEKLGRRLKVPHHDVASQFLEHATGVNELYVALTRRSSRNPAARVAGVRGKAPGDYARLPTAFRWLPSEELELPFESYELGRGKCDRRLQPDAILEDHLRRERYLIEYETGSASVRNDQRRSATLAKMARYVEFFAMYTGNDFKTTLYGRHFQDDLAPILLFLTRTKARRDTICEAAEERNRADPRKYDIRALTLDEAAAQFRLGLFGEELRSHAEVRPPSLAATSGVFIESRALDLVSQVVDESLRSIQAIRHAIEAGDRLVAKPKYPEQAQAAVDLLRRLRATTARGN
jgi:hypothetical protein